MLLEFDSKYTPIKDILYEYFYKSLKLSIKLQISKKSRQLDNSKALITITICTKAKIKI